MDKQEFLSQLRKRLSELPHEDREERLNFYSELISDSVEEGLSEQEAVAQIGDLDELVSQIVADCPRKKKHSWWQITLLVLGSPVWLPLLIAVAVVIIAVLASVWAVFAALVGGALGAVVAGVIFIATQHVGSGLAMIGAGLVCAGLSIFMFFGSKACTKGIIWLVKRAFRKEVRQ